MNEKEILKRINSVSNRTYIARCSIADEAKKLRVDDNTLEVKDGSLTFTGPIIGSNITATNNIELQNKADKDHTHHIDEIEGYEPYDDT